MKIDVLTIFPNMFGSPFAESIIKRAQDQKLLELSIHNLRDWSTDKYKSVDDRPFGGGAGMIMRVDIVDKAVTAFKSQNAKLKTKVVLLDTKGQFYTQKNAQQLANHEHLIIIAPHFEGIDHRVHEHIADEVFSIGPYVLTGGELPAMVVIDSVTRLIPGVINPDSLLEESYANFEFDNVKFDHCQEYPQYTRPAQYKDWKVPEALLSGNHAQIDTWRKEQVNK
ncbi:tRNA (guanosine(37)-N1)-methyltransferase TrmD [Candidatus Beckwithbacteria bacterium]|nr:tRNA (guanosine(37)-N1)-methyltransferase TrmD [Candidatus Beckwithbacteria bacterium]